MGDTRIDLLNRAGVLMFAEEPSNGDGGGEQEAGKPAKESKPVEDDGEDEPLGENGLKALKSERLRAAQEKKRADELAARLKEIDDAEKSELERAQERIAELEAATKAYEDAKRVGELRASVLASKNVPSEWADFVTGDSEDEMNKAADRILANLSKADDGLSLHGTRGVSGGSVEAGRESAKNFRP